MGRRKKEENAVVESSAPDRESTQILNAADVESAEAELLTEDAENKEDVVEAVSEEVAEEEKAEPKPRKRQRRKKPEAAPILSVESPNVMASQNMDEMVRQWNMIKDISTTISQNFEKIQGAFPKAVPDYVETGEFFKPQTPKVPFITKFATGASLVATLLSVLSLSLSQSARNAALSHEVAVRQAQSSAVPAPQIAFAPPAPREEKAPVPAQPAKRHRSKENFVRMRK
jgi:hypothetical protein